MFLLNLFFPSAVLCKKNSAHSAFKNLFSIFCFLSLLLSSFFIPLSSYSQNTFRHTYGGESHDHGRSVKQTFDGGYIVAGSTSSWGYGNSDVYVIKLDSLGIKQWSNVYGGSNVDWGYSIVQTPDSNYAVAGITNSFGAGGYDAYLIKIDTAGNLLWQKTYGGSDWDFTYSMQQTSDGGFILAGETYSYGNGNNDVYLIKTNASGDTAWTKTYGGIKEDYAKSVKQTYDGGYILAGATASFGAGKEDVYIIKTDALGDTVWVKTFGGDSADVAYCIYESTDSNYVIAAATSSIGAGKMDFYILELNQIGDSVWSDIFGGPDDDEWYTVTQDGNENFLIAGYSVSSIGQGKEEVFLMIRNKNLDYLQQHTFGGMDNERVYEIIPVNQDEFVMAGFSSSFGCGYADIYLIKSFLSDTSSLAIDSFCDSLDVLTINNPVIYNLTSVFPNPSSNEVNIILDKSVVQPVSIKLYNLMGCEVQTTINIISNMIVIKKGSLPNGIYYYVIESNKIISNSIILTSE